MDPIGAAAADILKESVVDKDGEHVDVKKLLCRGAEVSCSVLGLYFSASWCPPCCSFTPKLAEFYNSMTRDKLEVVFLSSDREQEAFNKYFAEMPWLALDYTKRDKKGELSKLFKIRGIPTLVLLEGASGKVITKDGRGCVMDDPQGVEFPWVQKPFLELMAGKLIKNGESDEQVHDFSSLAGKTVALYFSAHWCPPCKAFTPPLVKLYEQLQVENGHNVEFVFVSSDRTEESFTSYFSSMPWLALPFGDPRIRKVSKLFDVEGIPCLIVLDADGKVITKNGRMAANNDPSGKEFPWRPKPLTELTEYSAGKLNEDVCALLFTEGKAEDEKFAEEILKSLADEHFAKGEDQTIFFFWGGKNEFCERVREFSMLGDASPLLVLLHVPEQKCYVCEGDLNADVARNFIENFSAGKLQSKPLRGGA